MDTNQKTFGKNASWEEISTKHGMNVLLACEMTFVGEIFMIDKAMKMWKIGLYVGVWKSKVNPHLILKPFSLRRRKEKKEATVKNF